MSFTGFLMGLVAVEGTLLGFTMTLGGLYNIDSVIGISMELGAVALLAISVFKIGNRRRRDALMIGFLFGIFLGLTLVAGGWLHDVTSTAVLHNQTSSIYKTLCVETRNLFCEPVCIG